MRVSSSFVLALVALVLLGDRPAAAQPAAPAIAQNTDRVAEAAPSTDTQNWTASAGVILNSGNTRSYAISGGTSFQIVRGSNGFSLESAGNYGRAQPQGTTGLVTSAKNELSRLRFDHFFAERHAGFLSATHRWDPLSGLDTRVQAQIGYQYNFIRATDHRLWTEVGYDFTYDNLVQTAGLPADDTQVYHSARGYLGWDNHLNEHVHFQTGIEGLFNLEDTVDWRVNWQNTLTTQVAGRLSIELKFNLLYDNQPVPTFKNTDTRTTLNLVLDMW